MIWRVIWRWLRACWAWLCAHIRRTRPLVEPGALAAQRTLAGPASVVLAADNFNRADEAPLSGGGSWTAVTGSPGTFKLAGNVATPTNLGIDSEAYFSTITWPNDQFARAKIVSAGVTGAGAGVGLGLRIATGARTLYRLVVDHAGANNVEFARWVGGTYTLITRATQTWADGDTWEFQVQGTTLRALLNGAQVGADVIDATIAAGAAGIVFSSTEANTTTLDDWEGGFFATALVVPASPVGASTTWVVPHAVEPHKAVK